MSTLSLSIIALIVVVLVIVIAHNLWQAYRRNQEDPLAGLRKGRFDPDPQTLTGAPGRGGNRSSEPAADRREPVMDDGRRPRIPPSLAARPAQVEPFAGLEGPDRLREARGEGNHPSLALDDEDFIETPFENPAAVRPWSGREKPAAGKAAASPARAGGGPGEPGGAGRLAVDPLDEAGQPRPMMAVPEAGRPEQADEPKATPAATARQMPAESMATRQSPAAEPWALSHAQPAAVDAAAEHGAPGVAGLAPQSVPERADDRSAAAAVSPGMPAQAARRHDGAPAGAAGQGAARTAASQAAQPAQGAAEAAPGRGQTAAGQSEAPEWPMAQVEHAIILEPPAPVNTDRLIALTSSLRHVGSKPVRIEVERLGGTWSTLAAGDKAVRMRCSLLLANRQGPLNAVELSDFNAAIESLAVQLQAPFEVPEMAPVLRAARDLDALAARLDTQIEIVVELPEAADPGRLSALVRQQGLSDRGHGRYEAFADSGDSLFSLALDKNRDQIHFVLDVPRTAEHHDAWQGMVACAGSFAQALGGRLIDSGGRGLSVGMIETVSRQLARRYAELAQAGLAAGRPATLRVFH